MNAPANIESTRIAPAHGGKIMTSDEAMALATQDTMLTPRFYTTDFDALDAIDVSPVREEWDALIEEMIGDPNKTHFKHNDSFTGVIENLPPALRKGSGAAAQGDLGTLARMVRASGADGVFTDDPALVLSALGR